MGKRHDLGVKLGVIRRRADELEAAGKHDEAAHYWAAFERVEAELWEVKRADRVARRRARIRRNYGIVSGGLVLTVVEDVLPLLRAAVEIDRAYNPASYPAVESP